MRKPPGVGVAAWGEERESDSRAGRRSCGVRCACLPISRDHGAHRSPQPARRSAPRGRRFGAGRFFVRVHGRLRLAHLVFRRRLFRRSESARHAAAANGLRIGSRGTPTRASGPWLAVASKSWRATWGTADHIPTTQHYAHLAPDFFSSKARDMVRVDACPAEGTVVTLAPASVQDGYRIATTQQDTAPAQLSLIG